MKNYLVGAHRKIRSSVWPYGDRSQEGDLYEIYLEMYKISRASFRHFMDDEYEEIMWNEEIDSISQAMRLNWNNVYNLWHREPCNILGAGPDVIMVKPTKLFGQFTEFRMFNWTDPKQWYHPNAWNLQLPNYFNGDLKYYPSTMSADVWKLGQEMSKLWEETNTPKDWGNEQLIDNAMFWSQNIPFEQAHRPDLFYQAFMINSDFGSVAMGDAWNQFAFNDAHIIHFHSSRGAKARLEHMQYIAEQLGIPVE